MALAAIDALTSGATMLYTIAGSPDFNISCTVVIENRTNFQLLDAESYIHRGEMQSPPVSIRPKHKELFIAHKISLSPFGTAGVASWAINDIKKRVVVMWNSPYNRTIYRNWLAVGLTSDAKKRDGATLYYSMFHKMHENNLTLHRGNFYDSLNTLSVGDHRIKITGIMGSSEKTTAHIVVDQV